MNGLLETVANSLTHLLTDSITHTLTFLGDSVDQCVRLSWQRNSQMFCIWIPLMHHYDNQSADLKWIFLINFLCLPFTDMLMPVF